MNARRTRSQSARNTQAEAGNASAPPSGSAPTSAPEPSVGFRILEAIFHYNQSLHFTHHAKAMLRLTCRSLKQHVDAATPTVKVPWQVNISTFLKSSLSQTVEHIQMEIRRSHIDCETSQLGFVKDLLAARLPRLRRLSICQYGATLLMLFHESPPPIYIELIEFGLKDTYDCMSCYEALSVTAIDVLVPETYADYIQAQAQAFMVDFLAEKGQGMKMLKLNPFTAAYLPIVHDMAWANGLEELSILLDSKKNMNEEYCAALETLKCANSWSNLKSLEIGYHALTVENATAFAAMTWLKRLTRFTFTSGCDGAVEVLTAALSGGPLEMLCIESCGRGEVEALCNTDWPCLRELTLHKFSAINPEIFAEIFSSPWRCLEKLDIEGPHWDSDNLLWTMLRAPPLTSLDLKTTIPTLRSLTLESMHLSPFVLSIMSTWIFPHLNELTIDKCDLFKHHVEAIFPNSQGASSSPSKAMQPWALEVLRLHDASTLYSDAGVNVLAEAAALMPHLVELDLRRTGIKEQGVRDLVDQGGRYWKDLAVLGLTTKEEWMELVRQRPCWSFEALLFNSSTQLIECSTVPDVRTAFPFANLCFDYKRYDN